MNATVLAGPQLWKVLELINLLGEILVNFLLSLIELFIVLLLPTLKEGPLLISHLLSCTIDHSCQILYELLIITEIIFGDLECFLVDLH